MISHPLKSLYIKTAFVIGIFLFAAFAEKELMYDPVKGIIFVDKKAGSPFDTEAGGLHRSAEQLPHEKKQKVRGKSSSDIHVGRKKDPPDLYFKSGLEYYKNNDFNNAYKNFKFADSLEHRAEYTLLIGKALRKLGMKREMIKVMYDVVTNEADSDVADDALLELALLYKADDDYEKATQLFTKITEVYPFGTEYTTGEELPEIAREQRRLMRAEMINLLTTMGFAGEDLQDGYRKFQKAKGLPVTEVGDMVTIKTLKEMHREYLQQEERRTANKQRIDRLTVWIYGAIAAGGFNLILLLFLFIKIRSYQQHISEMQKMISELDVKKI
jgi:tetratricopeptide (TPR) repeat protein